MIELRKVVNSYLKSKHPRVYFESAPSDSKYPYITFDFSPIIDDGEGQQILTMDVDGWDLPKDGDTTVIETLMASVNGNSDIENPTGLNKKSIISNGLVASFFLQSKLPVIDDEPKIKRRKYIYEVKFFEGS